MLDYLISGGCINLGKGLKMRVFRASIFLLLKPLNPATGNGDPAHAPAGSVAADGGRARGDCYRKEAGLAFRAGA